MNNLFLRRNGSLGMAVIGVTLTALFSHSLHGAEFRCLERLGRLVALKRGKKSMAGVQDFKKIFPVNPYIERQLEDLKGPERAAVFDFFSKVPSSVGLLARKEEVKEVISIVISEKASFERIFLRALDGKGALSLDQKRALHLMIHKKWWFQGLLFKERGDLMWYGKLLSSMSPSVRLRHFLSSRDQTVKLFLDEVAQSSSWQRLFNKFSYSKRLSRLVDKAVHSSRPKEVLTERRSVLVQEMEKTTGRRAKKSLKRELAHIDQLLSIFQKRSNGNGKGKGFFTFSAKIPAPLEATLEMEKIALSVGVFWAFFKLLAVDVEEGSGDDTVFIEEWALPLEEDAEVPEEIGALDEILIDCNEGRISEDQCLESLKEWKMGNDFDRKRQEK
ncbi:MAG: hypothetical protein OXB88_07830 [Bacteriovoracales bacterium]|nr:hypothetical protein [Bacteriovoracales bacterium]